MRHAPLPVLLCLLLLSLSAAGPLPNAVEQDKNGPPSEAVFIRENDAAMTKMMAGMDVKPSGDVDRDFAAMMIPHHQGVIDMAAAELRHGHNEQLRRIAQEIIIDQQQKIAADPAPTQGMPRAMPNAMTARQHVTSQGNQK